MLNGGKAKKEKLVQEIVNASTKDAPGSFFQLTKHSNCLLSRDANKSICGLKYTLVIVLKSFSFNIHSVSSRIILLSLSATKLSTPGKCTAVNHILFLCTKVHISLAL